MSYLDLNGARTFYEVSGQGPPIVFVHGWSMNHTYWRAQVEHFSKTHRTIVYDLRGMGTSSGGERQYHFAQLVDDLLALMKALDIHRPVLCGHSLGGDLALQYAISHADTLSALAVVDAPGIRNIYTSALSYGLMCVGAAVASLFTKSPLLPFVGFCRYLFFSKQFPSSHPEVDESWKEQFLSNSARAVLHAGFAQARRENPLPRLGRINVPTLIVRGVHDAMVPQREAEAYLGIPGSYLENIEGSGHSPLIEQSEKFNQTIMRFITSLPSHGLA